MTRKNKMINNDKMHEIILTLNKYAKGNKSNNIKEKNEKNT